MLALLAVLALVGAPPSAALTAKPPATAGEAWRATLAVRGASPRSVVVTATTPARSVRTTARRFARGRYTVRLVFPSAGRWTLTARVSGRRLALGAVVVAAPEYRFDRPAALLAEPDGTLLLAEGGPQRVVSIDPATGRMAVVAGGFGNPFGLGRLPDGDLLVSSLQSIVRLDARGQRETVATFAPPIELGPLAVDAAGIVYVAATDHRIYRVDPSTHAIAAIAGTGANGDSGDGGPALAAAMSVPHGLVVDRDGSLLIADTDNDKIRRLDLRTGAITTLADRLPRVAMLVRAPDGTLYASALRSDSVFRIAPDGSRSVAARGLSAPWALAYTPDGTLYVVDADRATLNRVAADGSVTPVRLSAPM